MLKFVKYLAGEKNSAFKWCLAQYLTGLGKNFLRPVIFPVFLLQKSSIVNFVLL